MKLRLPCLKHKFSKIEKYIGNKQELKILDIGAGNHSASITKKRYPFCIYHGLDLDKNYHNAENDFHCMNHFYEMDLTKLEFDIIPNNYFNVIIISHVIEHLENGDLVIEKLLSKLSKNGIIYLEWPGIKSTKLPSKKGTLNFFDDTGHVRVYSLIEIYNLMLRNKMKYLEGGTRRYKRLIFLIPIKMIYDKLKYGYVKGTTFWDILGFAEYCIFLKL